MSSHLTLNDVLLFIAAKPRIVDSFDSRLSLQEVDYLAGVCVMSFHPNSERLDPSQHEPTIHRPRDGPNGVLQEFQPLLNFLVRRDRCSTNQVAVTTEILCRTMDNNIRSMVQRILQVRAQESVVD